MPSLKLWSAGVIFHLVLLLLSVPSEAAPSQDEIKAKVRTYLSQNHHPVSYDVARKFLMGQLHLEQKGSQYIIHDVYCQKDFSNRDFTSDPPGPNQIPKDTVLNTEHTWPQSRFSRQAQKDVQKSDLHHLFPSDSQMNAIRGNNIFGEVDHVDKPLKCNESRLGRNENGRWIFEPPKDHRGNVARALFYFSVRYQIRIDQEEEKALRKWNVDDPVDDSEIQRNAAIEKIQGNRNIFIDHNELVDNIADF